ncbi:MAG: Stp1/IreP family PP2C-type Ser/Thr phosphatase [Clostridiales bacterium]|nr:Stp1/IreP family PP2C-type Ser/Thr phosphatase [Clostridiales bacterium]MBS5877979.1 Stp1/IreP family PP2C-type Ser/Thr phosphatase [Clostridiales bacterium]MDU0939873.1 Stp1/IreP family PP2C-type Ser/Thr phosphatase [Clostridiales bacterium]MDU1042445.1 Stp1/IreP family PP2C-type Ser/Thr phosphatase [Clostridiales bacterium]
MKAYAVTDIGRVRSANQDYFYFTDEPIGELQNLFIVADGMGGHKAGDLASRYTVEKFRELVESYDYKDTVNIFTNAVTQVNQMLIEKALESRDYEGMGTTLVVATIEGSALKVANVGDSRLYIIGDDITQITRDHSLVEEMVQRGELDKESARVHVNKNIITRAIGADVSVVPEIFSVDLEKGDKILLCSDGLTNMVDDGRIARLIKAGGSVREICERLIEAANENGGSDNITAMVIDPEVER